MILNQSLKGRKLVCRKSLTFWIVHTCPQTWWSFHQFLSNFHSRPTWGCALHSFGKIKNPHPNLHENPIRPYAWVSHEHLRVSLSRAHHNCNLGNQNKIEDLKLICISTSILVELNLEEVEFKLSKDVIFKLNVSSCE